MIDLGPAIAREFLLRQILLATYPGESTRNAKWLRVRG